MPCNCCKNYDLSNENIVYNINSKDSVEEVIFQRDDEDMAFLESEIPEKWEEPKIVEIVDAFVHKKK